MIKTNVAEIKAKLSEYLDRALAGERIVICRHNKPIAELRAFEDLRVEPRPIGPLPGRPTFEVAAAFFEPLPDEELELWERGGMPGTLGPRSRAAHAPRVAESRAAFRRDGKRPPRRRRS
jgi:antitoxin (DNA-binding transcriptional repressor) of toxin-antitoxin stability system